MRYRISSVVVLAAVAVFGYGCVQGKALDDPATARSGSTTDTSKTISLLTISPTSVSGTVGQTTQLTATAENQGGNPIAGVTFTWASTNPRVASVDSSGNVTLVGAGNANITASAGGLTTSVPATATAGTVRIASVSVTPTSVTLNPGNTQQLQAVALDSVGNVITGTTFTWSSSNTSDATVSATGLVSAIAIGTAAISVSAGGKNATANVNVVAASPASVASITISPATASLTTGQATQLTASLKDSVGNILGGRTITWSTSNSGVVGVSSTGVATGVTEGTATITASSGGKQGTAQVTDMAPAVASIVVSPGWADLSARQTLQLTATALDASGKPISGQTIAWSSGDGSQATVSSTGVVTVVATSGTGSVKVYASDGGQQGHTTINLIAAPVSSVTVAPTTVDLNAGQTSQLTATAKDQYGDIITTDVASWNSSNTGVATVSSSGVVTAVGSGSASITVTIGGKQASASVTVASASVASVTVSPTSLSLTTGQSSGLTATAKDGSGNVLTGYPATWSSSNTGMATVSSSGVVTGAGVGSATITVAIGGKSANASVTVSAPAVASVAVSPTSTTLAVGATQQLSAVAKDASGNTISGATFSWSSSSSGVASVANGNVTAVSAGSATITASSGGQSASATITVNSGSTVSLTYDNEPPGFTSFTERPFSAINENGWGTTFGSGNLAIVQDNSAPKSPPNVMQVTYPVGLPGGDSPFQQDFSPIPNSPSEFYGCIWVKYSPNFVGNPPSGVNKILYVWLDDGPTPAVYLSSQASGSENFQPQVRTQDATYQDLRPNVSGQTGYTFPRNVWVKWEWYLKVNTPGNSDGIVRVWMNGVQVSEYDNVLLSNSTAHWSHYQLASYWGGIGGTIGAAQYMYLDHLYGSGK